MEGEQGGGHISVGGGSKDGVLSVRSLFLIFE